MIHLHLPARLIYYFRLYYTVRVRVRVRIRIRIRIKVRIRVRVGVKFKGLREVTHLLGQGQG
jgi:hypothetical protein